MIAVLFAFLLGLSSHAGGQTTQDIIQPVRLTPGRTDTLLVSDMFMAAAYDLRILSNMDVSTSYDVRTRKLTLRPTEAFRGATLVDLVLGKTTLSIPVIVERASVLKQPQVFRYRSEKRPERVVVTGSFNSWNKRDDRLLDADGNGTYELTLFLEPGSYIYKFIVDDLEILDPANPEKTPTGFDDFNSVLRVADPDSSRHFLHVGAYRRTAGGVELSYVYDAPGVKGRLRSSDVIALLDNQRVAAKWVRVSGETVTLRLPSARLKGERTVRVLVSSRGQTSNLQQAKLRDGVPAGAGSKTWTWEDGMIYSMMVDRFRNGDRSIDRPIAHDSIFVQANYQGGDLRGIIQTLDEGYFDSLGVNVLWVSPVYDNPNTAFREYPPPHRWYSGYHGYWPISDTAIEEKFGTMTDLRELIAKAHRRGIRVLLDFVAHHVHIDHPFYRDHPEWFGTLDLPDGRKNLRLWDEFRLSTWFEPYMPSFDFARSAEALEVVSKNAVWWLQQTGADGFRHDAVKHVPNEFWRDLTRRLYEQVDRPRGQRTYQIGETFGDYDLVASYVNNGQLSAQFNFNLSYFAIPVFLEPDRSFSSLDFHMKRSFRAFGTYHLMGNIMDSHDKVRFMAYADGKVRDQGVDTREMAWNNPPSVDHASSYRKAELYLAYMFTTPGLPVVYYGSEFGMTGADDPDNRRLMRFGNDLSANERELLQRTRAIVHLRKDHSALRYGDHLTLLADVSTYAYLRTDFHERLLVVLHKRDEPATVSLELPRILKSRGVRDVRTGESFPVREGRVHVPVAPIGWRVLEVID